MKTAEQVLTEAYAHAPADGRDYNHTWIIEAMHAFAIEACREQREICAAHAKMGDTYLPRTDEVQYYIDKESIKNAPEPKF